MSSDSLHIGARSIVILSYQTLLTEYFSTNMLLLTLSLLYYFNYTIWDIVIPGFSLKWPYWPKSEVKHLLTYLLIYMNRLVEIYHCTWK